VWSASLTALAALTVAPVGGLRRINDTLTVSVPSTRFAIDILNQYLSGQIKRNRFDMDAMRIAYVYLQFKKKRSVDSQVVATVGRRSEWD
jgi:hypothetical protein